MKGSGNRNQPPVSTRFRKGQSGNPKGRPRKRSEPPSSAFDLVIDRTLTIVVGGRPREVTVEEALQHKTYRDAIAGDRAAQRKVLKMIAKREKERTKRAPPSSAIELRMEPEDPTNADEALLILGIASRDPRRSEERTTEREQLLLESWAVEAALNRRAARCMGKLEVDSARHCTRDADTLHWPEPVEP